MSTKSLVLFTGVAGLFLHQASGEDWTQYRGPRHDGTSAEHILASWTDGAPQQIWKTPLTAGFSTLTVSGGKAFTMVMRDIEGANQEVCVALDAGTGKEIWAVSIGMPKFDDGGNRGVPGNDGGDGPRSTPSVDGDRVYTYSSRMVLKCLDAATGKEIWRKDVIKEHGGQIPHWGSAASPLIDGNLILVEGGGAGQAFLAFDKKDGHVVWKGQDDGMTQSTPVVATILGVRQVIFFTQKGLVAVVPATGSVLWRYSFPYRTSTAMSPIVSGDMVYCSAGYGVGASACKISKEGDVFSAKQLWFQQANVINNHWSTPVCVDGYLYGLFGQAQFGRGPMKCVEVATGKILWSKDGFGPGGCTLADGHVLVLSDVGDLVMVKPTPSAYKEEGRSHILAGKCWNSVSISNGRLYARSTKEGVCLNIAPKDAGSQ